MTKIKICGMMTLQAARTAAEAGADMLGFNFHANSRRYIERDACAHIAAVLRREHPSVQLVGVFVNASPTDMLRTLMDCGLDLAQLSGDESPGLCAALGGRAFKAFHGVPRGDVGRYARSTAPAFLVDGHASGAYGGTGIAADWSACAELGREYPLLLAGGLQPDNVAQAIERVQPWGVDVASGVESEPGIKDAKKMRAFVEAVRCAEARA